MIDSTKFPFLKAFLSELVRLIHIELTQQTACKSQNRKDIPSLKIIALIFSSSEIVELSILRFANLS